ncbi:MAG TPA: thermonuclease family protein [Desulfobacteria bacterium]|nr:thermonuclease family protein [Desulfobacteria bacterium]
MKKGQFFKNLIIFLAFLSIWLVGCTSGNSRAKLPDDKAPRAADSESSSGSGRYKVLRVVDGDTIVISYKGKNEKLRFIGINTPEAHHPEKGAEPYGVEAAGYTKRLLENQAVRIKFDVQQRDKYGRLLGYVYLADGTFVNARLLAEGYAQVMTVPPDVRYAEYFVRLEQEARKAEKGLWGIFYYTMDGNLEAE